MQNETWVIVTVSLLFVVLTATIHNSYYLLLDRLKDVMSTQRQFRNVAAHDAVGEFRHTFRLNIVFSLSLSLMLADIVAAVPPISSLQLSTPQLTAILTAVILLCIYFKTAVYTLVNTTFFSAEQTRRWISIQLFLTSLLAFPMFPLSAVDIFSAIPHQIVTYCLLFMLIAYKITIFSRLVSHFQGGKYGGLLIFLYFCSVEVAPLLLIAKLCTLI